MNRHQEAINAAAGTILAAQGGITAGDLAIRVVAAYEAHMRPEAFTVPELAVFPVETVLLDREGDLWRVEDEGIWPVGEDTPGWSIAKYLPARVIHWGAE